MEIDEAKLAEGGKYHGRDVLRVCEAGDLCLGSVNTIKNWIRTCRVRTEIVRALGIDFVCVRVSELRRAIKDRDDALEKVCLYCSRQYTAGKHNQRYCSVACREDGLRAIIRLTNREIKQKFGVCSVWAVSEDRNVSWNRITQKVNSGEITPEDLRNAPLLRKHNKK